MPTPLEHMEKLNLSAIDNYPIESSSTQGNSKSDFDNLSVSTEKNSAQPLKYSPITNLEETSNYAFSIISPNSEENVYFKKEHTFVYGYSSEDRCEIINNSLRAVTENSKEDYVESQSPKSTVFELNDTTSCHDNKFSQLTLKTLSMLTEKSDENNTKENFSCDPGVDMKWRDPNLSEVISFLNSPNNSIKANAAAYLQHLCYMDDPNKQRTRILGGIPPLVQLLSYNNLDIHKNACGALRNLSFGRQNDENKRAINDAGGVSALVNLLCRVSNSEVRELVTGVLWNLSSCEDLKRTIIKESVTAIVSNIIKPHSGWDPVCTGEICFSTIFRNASGVLRNVSSAGECARAQLREAEHLIESLFHVIKTAIASNNMNNKTVENCVCILRNLSFRCQEVEDPNYDLQLAHVAKRSSMLVPKGENLGCFGTIKKKKTNQSPDQLTHSIIITNSTPNGYSINRSKLLWQPDVIHYYLALLQSCSNPETLEAAAGSIQNLAACFWQPSVDIRAAVRKEKGLPILVELLRMEVDRVVCAVATALRNLALDQRNRELIGKYAMRDLVQKLPSGNIQQDQGTSDDTITAVLATINEVIKRNPEFSRALLEAGGIERLLNITKQRQKYTACVLRFSSQVLYTMWQHHDLRDVYKKNGWKEQDFTGKYMVGHHLLANSPNYLTNTLNRPMASQSRTKYEDKTIQRMRTDSKKKITDRKLDFYKLSAENGHTVRDTDYADLQSQTRDICVPMERRSSSK